MKILGVKPGEIEGMEGTSFWSDTPEAQRRGQALPLMAAGTDEKGVVLELRRMDDGRPGGSDGGAGQSPAATTRVVCSSTSPRSPDGAGESTP